MTENGSLSMLTLRLYHDIARCRSFSEAARLHGITQPAASQRVGQLEKQLGVTLLDRSVRPLKVTDAGRVFLEGVADVLQRYDTLERTVMAAAAKQRGAAAGGEGAGGTGGVGGMGGAVRGRVKVSAIYSSGIDLLRQVGERFAVEHPQIAVQIDYDKPDAVHEAVVAGRADVGILSYPARFKKLGVIPLRDEEMAVVCPPGHPLARGRKGGKGAKGARGGRGARGGVVAAELAGQEMVGFDTNLPVARQTAEYLKAHGGAAVVTHRFDNLDTLKHAVAATGRLAILPRRTVQAEVANGSLAALDLTPRLVRPMGLIYRRGVKSGVKGAARGGAREGGQTNGLQPAAAMPPCVAVFVEYLLEHARGGEAAEPLPSPTPPSPSSSSVDTSAESASAASASAKSASRPSSSTPRPPRPLGSRRGHVGTPR